MHIYIAIKIYIFHVIVSVITYHMTYTSTTYSIKNISNNHQKEKKNFLEITGYFLNHFCTKLTGPTDSKIHLIAR